MSDIDGNTPRVLSCGFGKQSTLLGELVARGELPRATIIHADLGWERQLTYDIRDFYTERWRRMGLDVRIIKTADIRVQGAEEHVHIPFWTDTSGMLRRQCTRQFKIRPIRREIRRVLGFDPSKPPAPPPGSAVLWLGITVDESKRAKPSEVQYIEKRYPLLGLGFDRQMCSEWFQREGLPEPIKSACVCCPFRRASEWIEMRDQAPDEWEAACLFDEANRENTLAKNPDVEADQLYVWRGYESLRTADLEAVAAKERRIYGTQLLMFGCESGYCGV